MLALLLIRVLRLLNSSVQISFEFKHDAATKLVHGQGKARDVTIVFVVNYGHIYLGKMVRFLLFVLSSSFAYIIF